MTTDHAPQCEVIGVTSLGGMPYLMAVAWVGKKLGWAKSVTRPPHIEVIAVTRLGGMPYLMVG